MHRYKKGRYKNWKNRQFKRAWKNRKSIAKTAFKAYAIAKSVSSLINTEFKTYTQAINVTPTTTGSITNLIPIGQGDTDDDRNGDSVKIKSCSFRFKVSGSGSGSESQTVRCIIFIDKQNANPTVTDPTVAVSSSVYGVLETSVVQSFKSNKNRKRFIILKDFMMHVDQGERIVRYYTWYKRMNMKTEWNDTVTTPQTNGLWMLLISSEATNAPNVLGSFRTRYIDN